MVVVAGGGAGISHSVVWLFVTPWVVAFRAPGDKKQNSYVKVYDLRI